MPAEEDGGNYIGHLLMLFTSEAPGRHKSELCLFSIGCQITKMDARGRRGP